MAYRKNEDYDSLINSAVSKGDYASAARYEQSKNQQIAFEGGTGVQTNKYTGNLLPDYSQQLTSLKAQGAPSWMISTVDDKRQNKSATTANLGQYYNDPIHDDDLQYIANDPTSFANIKNRISSYQNQIDSMLGTLANTDYSDYLRSSEYGALESKYQSAGNKAMLDTLGQISARTGGIASSYGSLAAQGAYQDYMSQLSDAAMAAYDNKRAQELATISALNTQYGNSANMYQDEIDNYMGYLQFLEDQENTDWSQQFQEDSAALANQNYNQEWAASEEQRGIDNALNWAQFYETQNQNAIDNNYRDRALAADIAYQNAQLAQNNSSSSSSSSSDSSGLDLNYTTIIKSLMENGGMTYAEAVQTILNGTGSSGTSWAELAKMTPEERAAAIRKKIGR